MTAVIVGQIKRKEVGNMNYKELVDIVAKQEGKRHFATIGDTREIVRITLEQLSLMNTVDLGKLFGKYVKTRTKKFGMGSSKSKA